MKRVACLVVLLLASSIAASAADSVIYRGIDTFTTTTDGSTHYNFANNPIPAGFFCKGSAPFVGTIPLKGLPLVTAEKDQLGGADTIVERLDDAIFDKDGVAVTRIKMAALSLVSIEPLQTSCGAFHVYATLNGDQRSTTMYIYRENERGGTFVAPLAVDARMRFVPVTGSPSRPLELTGSFNLGSSRIDWSIPKRRWFGEVAPVTVDTNGDGAPDRFFAGSSNFAAGYPGRDSAGNWLRACTITKCHADEGDNHCVTYCCTCEDPR